MLRPLVLCLISLVFQSVLNAQTIEVDTTHAVNRFLPKETLGAGVDRIPVEAIDKDLQQPNLDAALSSGWQPVSFRQNTELAVEAWHWNPQGTWSDPQNRGYFTGSAMATEIIRYSYGYRLPRRGFTRNDGTENVGFSRVTDGDPASFWKSNPYLTERFTGESDALHPQWLVLDLAQTQLIDAIRIAWAEPYATQYAIQYWTGDDPIKAPTHGVWQTFQQGSVAAGKGGAETIQLNATPLGIRYVRIWMTHSSNTCTADGSADPRNCVGYAIREIYLGTLTKSPTGTEFHDVIRHTTDQEQTATYCSSVDPWHTPDDQGSKTQAQVGFDLFYQSGVTRGLPAMIPVAMLYDTPDNAAAEIAYLKHRNYPISYIEMGEEADGQYMLPEDYAALYLQWATAIHRVDPSLKLGGPSFQGVNRDIEVWPDANGKASWTARFLDYLKQHNRLQDLSFFSFEHYPYDPCRIPWGSLYEEPELMRRIMETWREDGVPATMPMFVTEGNLSSSASETYQDIFSALWLADYVGSFLANGGKGLYFFHYLPLKMEPGCNGSPGTFGLFTVDRDYKIEQPLAQLFVSQLINKEWVQQDGSDHEVFPARGDIEDGAGHQLVTAYAVKRPDGHYSLMLVNRDQQTAHKVGIEFRNEKSVAHFSGPVEISTFGSEQYHWQAPRTHFMAHSAMAGESTVVVDVNGRADPDGPIARQKLTANRDTEYTLPPSSVVIIKGDIVGR